MSLLHSMDIDSATAVVDALVERTMPLLWRTGEVTRVLDTSLSLGDQTLLLLYGAPMGLSKNKLAANLEQDRGANYRRVLSRLHSARSVEYDRACGMVQLSPKGVREVEKRLLPALGF